MSNAHAEKSLTDRKEVGTGTTKQIKCQYCCEMFFSTTEQLKLHFKKKECSGLKKKIDNLKQKLAYQNMEHKVAMCDVCDKIFENKTILAKHKYSMHKKIAK